MRIITIKDIASKAGVSTATVSYVINNTRPVAPIKRQRVLDVIAETGYYPNRVAKSLRTQKTGVIGVLAEDILGFPTAGIINGISEYVEQTDYHILLNDLRMMDSLFNRYDQIIHQKDKINKALELLVVGARVDAVIYIGMFDRNISGVVGDIKKPVVIAYSTSTDENTCSVTYENQNASAKLARHLFELGHRRIAVITGLAHTAPAQSRLAGIHKVYQEAGLILDSTLVKNGDWGRSSGHACMAELLKLEGGLRPTAVMAMNDYMAIGAIDAIREAGLRVPDDISVVGFDNRDVADYVFPRLTTAEIDLKAIGYTAAQVADQKLTKSGPYAGESSIVIPCRLVLRDTTSKNV